MKDKEIEKIEITDKQRELLHNKNLPEVEINICFIDKLNEIIEKINSLTTYDEGGGTLAKTDGNYTVITRFTHGEEDIKRFSNN